MTLRQQLRRRACLAVAAPVLVIGIGGVFWWLGYSGQTDHWWPSLAVLVVCFFLASRLGALAIRCPKCGVRITGEVLTALTSRKAARRYNFCPGCGTSLDGDWGDTKRK